MVSLVWGLGACGKGRCDWVLVILGDKRDGVDIISADVVGLKSCFMRKNHFERACAGDLRSCEMYQCLFFVKPFLHMNFDMLAVSYSADGADFSTFKKIATSSAVKLFLGLYRRPSMSGFFLRP